MKKGPKIWHNHFSSPGDTTLSPSLNLLHSRWGNIGFTCSEGTRLLYKHIIRVSCVAVDISTIKLEILNISLRLEIETC